MTIVYWDSQDPENFLPHTTTFIISRTLRAPAQGLLKTWIADSKSFFVDRLY